MQENNDITDISALMDAKYGKVGTPKREQFRREAYAYYMGQILHDKITVAAMQEAQNSENLHTLDMDNFENFVASDLIKHFG